MIRSGVLVIDDDQLVRDALRACLLAADQAVYLAANGADGLDIATRTKPALVICDINMPIMDGLTICERMRQLPDYGGIPIAMLTFHDDKETRAAALQAGATAFLTKPFRPMNVLDLLAHFLPIKQSSLATIRQGNENPAAAVNLVARMPMAQNHGGAGLAAGSQTDHASHDRTDPARRLLNAVRGLPPDHHGQPQAARPPRSS